MKTAPPAWQRQLVYEHRQLCLYYRIKLPTPLLVISEGRRRVGCWQPRPEPGVITISHRLVTECSWDVVLEVLKHEICHQYVHQVLGQGGQPPHGPAFQQAARKLGLHPAFRRAQNTIPRLLESEPGAGPPAPKGLTARVEKLLALAASANRHEAELAMTKAGELIRKHNLQYLAGAAEEQSCDYLVIDSGRQRRAPHHNHLAAILREFFFVKTVSYRLYNPAGQCHHQVLELLGRRENLAVARHVYHFLEEQLPRLWHKYRRRSGAAGRERNSFYLGVLGGLREKLRAAEAGSATGFPTTQSAGLPTAVNPAALPVVTPDQPRATCSQLVCAADRALQEFHGQRYPHLQQRRGRGIQLYEAGYQAGQREGRRLTIHQVLNQRNAAAGKQLPRLP